MHVWTGLVWCDEADGWTDKRLVELLLHIESRESLFINIILYMHMEMKSSLVLYRDGQMGSWSNSPITQHLMFIMKEQRN